MGRGRDGPPGRPPHERSRCMGFAYSGGIVDPAYKKIPAKEAGIVLQILSSERIRRAAVCDE